MAFNQHLKDVLVGGLEAGGTKFKCVVGYSNGEIISETTFPTSTPTETLKQAKAFFDESIQLFGEISALGIAHFGPVDIDMDSVNYGKVLKTAKTHWSHTNVVEFFTQNFDVPTSFQSDVNGAATGEYHLGNARGLENFVYITVGTGIGGGVFVNGELLNHKSHPEIGHMMLPQLTPLDKYKGCCPFHENCLEGLASGPAIEKRWGTIGAQLGADHPAWDLEAHYLALLCVNLTYCFAPEKIIFGGGVMQQIHLVQKIREKFSELTHGYLPALTSSLSKNYIEPAGLGEEAATKGSLILAKQVFDAQQGVFTH